MKNVSGFNGSPNGLPAITEEQKHNAFLAVENLVPDNDINLPSDLIFIDAVSEVAAGPFNS